jgi:NAD+ kinase
MLVAHPGKKEALEAEKELAAYLTERGISASDDSPDLVISLGGDGSMLRAAQFAHSANVPLLGINLGALGYLTEAECGEEREAIERILSGRYFLEERLMLSCDATTDSGARLGFVGLNEVLVERATRYRVVRLRVTIDGQHFADFNADGVIVATPTGSTAYALSAGGPIVSPRADSLIVVPVSPHRIFVRPVVLAPDEIVSIELLGPEQRASLSLDGAIGGDLQSGAQVTVSKHPRPLKLVRLGGPGFIERLRTKLDLP